MAKTDDLIGRLAKDLTPVRASALGRLLAIAFLPAAVTSAAFIYLALGLRPDLAAATALPAFWVKCIYPLALVVTGLAAMKVVARPGGIPIRAGMSALAIYLLLAGLGLWQLHVSSAGDYPRLIFGLSYWFCPFIIIGSAAPVFAANIWFLRRSAPTHLRLAGFVAGITAGATGAWTYSWACIENGLTFVALWYTLGIVLCGIGGSLIGVRLLRW